MLFGEIYDFAGSIRTVNIAHPFRDGNGRSMRIWLDLVFKKEMQQVVDVKGIDHSYYYEGYNIYKVEEL